MITIEHITKVVEDINTKLISDAFEVNPSFADKCNTNPPITFTTDGTHTTIFFTGVPVWDSKSDNRKFLINPFMTDVIPVREPLVEYLWREIISLAGGIVTLYTVMVNILNQKGINN